MAIPVIDALFKNPSLRQLINHAPVAMQLRNGPTWGRPPQSPFMEIVHPLLKCEQTPFRLAQIPQWLHFAATTGANRVVGGAALMRKIRPPALAAPESLSFCSVLLFDFIHIQSF
jgi:hypothetical protein